MQSSMFIDLFKKFDVLKTPTSVKGDAKLEVVQNRRIGKRVVKVLGNLPSSNILRIPRNTRRTIGLRSRYVLFDDKQDNNPV